MRNSNCIENLILLKKKISNNISPKTETNQSLGCLIYFKELNKLLHGESYYSRMKLYKLLCVTLFVKENHQQTY